MATVLRKNRLFFGIFLILGILGFVAYLKMSGLMFDFDTVKMYRSDLESIIENHFYLGIFAYILIYTVVVTFSLPFATPLTVISGFLFGNIIGTFAAAIAASTGATLSVIINRFFFLDFIQYKFGAKLKQLNSELKGHGFRDIFLMRLAPLIPFSLINVFAALTSVKIRDFYFATVLGTLPFTFVYVNAGTQIARVDSLGDIISVPSLIGITLIATVVSLPIFIRRRKKAVDDLDTPSLDRQ